MNEQTETKDNDPLLILPMAEVLQTLRYAAMQACAFEIAASEAGANLCVEAKGGPMEAVVNQLLILSKHARTIGLAADSVLPPAVRFYSDSTAWIYGRKVQKVLDIKGAIFADVAQSVVPESAVEAAKHIALTALMIDDVLSDLCLVIQVLGDVHHVASINALAASIKCLGATVERVLPEYERWRSPQEWLLPAGWQADA